MKTEQSLEGYSNKGCIPPYPVCHRCNVSLQFAREIDENGNLCSFYECDCTEQEPPRIAGTFDSCGDSANLI